MDEKIGPLSYYDSTGKNEQMLVKPYSEGMAQKIDKEVQSLVNFACQRTKDLLMEHKDELEALTMLLMEKEVVDNVDLECIMGKRSKKNDAPADEL